MARSFHTHDLGQLVIGCPACIEQTRATEQAARWDHAPARKVTWKCTYNLPDSDKSGPPEELSFTLEVKVPADATSDEIDNQYASLTGEAFVLALPDTVPMNHTDYAAETMAVATVTIGAPVTTDTPPAVDLDQLPMFTVDEAS